MKKLCSIFLAAAVLAGLLAAPAYAADKPSSGLSLFEDVLEYAPDTFSDVPADSWYADGVRVVYQKGIMNGVGGGRFDPFQTITWAQAVTIAARIDHAYSFNGASLGEARPDEPWYAPAFSYAYDRRIILRSNPALAEPETTPIARQDMAHLFRHVLGADGANLPAINDTVPTDLDAVASHLRSEVQTLCAAGIFTGRNNGEFDPEGFTTRAETAVIVSRLLDPGLRVSRDLSVPRSLREWGGNFYNGGFASVGSGVTYFLYSDREYTASGSFIDHGGEIIARTDSGQLHTVFTCPDPLDSLLLGDDGMLYVGGQHRLRRVSPGSGEAELLYTAPDLLVSYVLYGGGVYILERYTGGGNPDNWRYRIGRVEENGTLDVLADGMSFTQSVPTARLSCFGGKLYFAMRDAATNTDRLYAVDLSTKAMEKVLDHDSCLTGYPTSGATVWYTRELEDGLAILRASLLLPDAAAQASLIPARYADLPLNAFANGGVLYLQSPGAKTLWRIGGGELERVLTYDHQDAGCCTILKDCIIVHPGASIGSLHMDDITVYLSDGTSLSYSEYLGK